MRRDQRAQQMGIPLVHLRRYQSDESHLLDLKLVQDVYQFDRFPTHILVKSIQE